MPKHVLLICAILCLPHRALAAQATASQLAGCAGVKIAALRLHCFDALAKPKADSTAAPAEFAGTVAVGNWLAKIETDPITDLKNATFFLEAASGSRYSAPMLVLQCKSGELNAFVSTRKYLSDNIGVTIRFGSDQPARERWSKSGNKTALFVPGDRKEVERFIKKLVQYEKLVVQVEPYSEAPMSMVFELGGITQVGQQISAICKIPG